MGRKGEAGARCGPGNTQRDRSNCFSSSSLMHNNGMSAERLRVRSVIRACDGRWMGAMECGRVRRSDRTGAATTLVSRPKFLEGVLSGFKPLYPNYPECPPSVTD